MRKSLLLLVLTLCVGLLALSGCKTTLEPGGAYAPVVTNLDGTLTPTQAPDVALALADSAYKTAYELVAGACKLEYDNRAALWKVSPKIKFTLDAIRPTVAEIDLRWAKARKAYLENPTPAGLTGLQLVLAELKKLIPVATSQLDLITSAAIQPK